MVDTARIMSEFDVEVQIGRGWILTALRTLAAEGLLIELPPEAPPGSQVDVTEVEIIFDQDPWDLDVVSTIAGFPFPTLVATELSADGTQLHITNNRTDDESAIPFDLLDGLAAPPTMVKLRGDDDHEPCLALLANLDLRTSPQNEEPLPAGEHLPRGRVELATSFLPTGVDLAVGLGQATFSRFANDVWHTELRAPDGTHPLPDADDRQGTWTVVAAAPQPGRMRITLIGEVPIDIWPDATVRVDVYLTPTVTDGVAGFQLDIETDVDTGVLGSLFAGIIGGLIGLLLGALTGGALLPFIVGGYIVGIMVLEIAEMVVAGIVTRTVKARIDGEPVPPPLTCDDGVVVLAVPTGDGGGFALGALDAIPTSVRIATEEPDPLHLRHVLVVNRYDDVVVNGNGLAFTATATTGEAFEPVRSTLVGAIRPAPDQPLTSLVYDTAGAQGVEIGVGEVVARAAEDDLTPPFKPTFPFSFRAVIAAGRIPVVCLTPGGDPACGDGGHRHPVHHRVGADRPRGGDAPGQRRARAAPAPAHPPLERQTLLPVQTGQLPGQQLRGPAAVLSIDSARPRRVEVSPVGWGQASPGVFLR
ncbi:hypothetical protein BH24ACT7_BH24ACT7_16020 [soil metagenome]